MINSFLDPHIEKLATLQKNVDKVKKSEKALSKERELFNLFKKTYDVSDIKFQEDRSKLRDNISRFNNSDLKDYFSVNYIYKRELSGTDSKLYDLYNVKLQIRAIEPGSRLLRNSIDALQRDHGVNSNIFTGIFLEIYDCFNPTMNEAVKLERKINTEYEKLVTEKKALEESLKPEMQRLKQDNEAYFARMDRNAARQVAELGL